MAPSGAVAKAFGAKSFCLVACPFEQEVEVQPKSLESPFPITVVTT